MNLRGAFRGCERLALSAGGLLLLLVTGCASQAPLPDLATLPAQPKKIEHLVIEAEGQTHEILGVIEHDHDSLRMALLSVQGQRLLTLIQDADGARFLPDGPFNPPFTARWLAGRLAWSLWPVAELRRSFKRGAWSVRQDASGHSVYHRNALVASIRSTDNCTRIDDLQTGYRLYIIPIELASQPKEYLCPAL